MSRSSKKDYPKKFDSRRFDHSCRNHGGCGYCVNNRTFFDRKSRNKADKNNQEIEFFNYFELLDPTDVNMDVSDELMEKFEIDMEFFCDGKV
jgi:hypothetical protein